MLDTVPTELQAAASLVETGEREGVRAGVERSMMKTNVMLDEISVLAKAVGAK